MTFWHFYLRAGLLWLRGGHPLAGLVLRRDWRALDALLDEIERS